MLCPVCSPCQYGLYDEHKHLFFPSPLQDPHAEEFEDKEWTFVIENVSTELCLCPFVFFIFVVALTHSRCILVHFIFVFVFF